MVSKVTVTTLMLTKYYGRSISMAPWHSGNNHACIWLYDPCTLKIIPFLKHLSHTLSIFSEYLKYTLCVEQGLHTTWKGHKILIIILLHTNFIIVTHFATLTTTTTSHKLCPPKWCFKCLLTNATFTVFISHLPVWLFKTKLLNYLYNIQYMNWRACT